MKTRTRANTGPRQRKYVEHSVERTDGVLSVTFPIDTTSPKSMHEHHWAKQTRVKQERTVTGFYLLTARPLPSLPLTITVTRLAPKLLDAHDNLPMSLAAVVDEIADSLEVQDNDPRICWRYSQEQQAAYGVRICFKDSST